MNTHLGYQHHGRRVLPQTHVATAVQPTPTELSLESLAIHPDPSLPASGSVPVGRGSGPGVGWVRLSDLGSLVGATVAGRGIDLQADLARRARRAPLTAGRAVRRVVRTRTGDADAPAAMPWPQGPSQGVAL